MKWKQVVNKFQASKEDVVLRDIKSKQLITDVWDYSDDHLTLVNHSSALNGDTHYYKDLQWLDESEKEMRIYAVNFYNPNYRDDIYGKPEDLDDETFEVVSRHEYEDGGCDNWSMEEFIEDFKAGKISYESLNDFTFRIIES